MSIVSKYKIMNNEQQHTQKLMVKISWLSLAKKLINKLVL